MSHIRNKRVKLTNRTKHLIGANSIKRNIDSLDKLLSVLEDLADRWEKYTKVSPGISDDPYDQGWEAGNITAYENVVEELRDVISDIRLAS